MLKFINKVPKINSKGVDWQQAPDIKACVKNLIKALKIDWIESDRLFFFRSWGSKTYSRARIWGLPKVWQKALKIKPAYIIEVISERFDGLKKSDREEVLLHEIAHIPKNFSGSLVPHYRKGKRKFKDKVSSLVVQYKKKVF